MAGEQLERRAVLTTFTVPPDISGTFLELDGNVVVSNAGGSISATPGHVQIFGNSAGRIDGTPNQSNEDLTITAAGFITVTGGIGGMQRPDDLTLTSVNAQPINLQQVVSLTGDLRVTKAGAFTVGSTVTVDRDLVIDQADMVTFSGNVTVGRNLTITNATGVTFAGTLTVGGSLTIVNSTGTTRFMGDVSVGSAAVTSTTLVQVMADFTTTAAAGDGDVTFTTDQINFTTASLGVATPNPTSTLVIQPRTTSRALTIASPPGTPAGLSITDADITAIQPGWKRVVFGDEAAGTGAVKIGSIGSQYGGFSHILNTTTIVGGTVQVVQPVDVMPIAIYLELIAHGTGAPGSGAVMIDAPINQTEGERSAWVRLQSAGSIAINAPVWSDQIVSLITTAGGTITQGGTAAAITTPALGVDADGPVTLADSGNAFSLVAIKTTNDSVVLREDSGYSISQINTIDDGRDSRPTATVTGINTGTATVRLVTVSGGTASTVGQGRAILAGGLGLEGVGTDWNLSLATNDVATLAANTGSVVFRDVDDLTIGTVAAVSPRSEISGITVARTLDVEAGTTVTITAAGDIISAASSGLAVNLEAPSGISTAGDMITAGANVEFDHATTLTGDIVLDLEDGPNRGLVTFFDAVDGTTAGQESLTIGGDLDAELSIGAAVALQSLSVSGDSALAGGITLRTTGNQTYSGEASSVGTITIQAGSGSTVAFEGEVSLGGLVTARGDTTAYNVTLTGSPVSITNAVTFANTGTVTLGNADTDLLTFVGGLTSTAPSLTNLAGTIATANANASFGTTMLTADTTVSTGSGDARFTGTVDGGQALAVNAAGTTTFGRMVGYTTPLVSLVTDAAGTTAIDEGTIITSGAAGMVFNDPVTIGNSTDLTAGNEGAITFASLLDGAYSVVARTAGITTFGGAVGSVTPLTLVEADAGGETRINGGSVETSGPNGQAYHDAVMLGAATTLTAANAGAVIFVTTLDGDHSLAVNTAGLTSFGRPVGGTTPLSSLTTDAAGMTKIAGGSVTTSGAAGQVYNDAVELQANTTLTAEISAPITFASTLDGMVTLNADTDGTTTFGGAVGGTTPLGSLTTDAGGTTRIDGGSVRTLFAGQTYGDAVLLGANTTLTADNNGMIRFANTIDGAFTLAANTQGETGFDGAVGTETPLVSLTTDAAGTTVINGGSIKTSGSAGQVYNDAVTLGADTVVTADNTGTITFASTVDGPHALSANTQGTTTFGGAVGGLAPLAAVVTDAGGTTRINGGSITTTMPLILASVPGGDVGALVASGQFYDDAVILGANTVLTAGLLTIMPLVAVGGDAIAFASTVDGAFSLIVNTVGSTTFGGAVGDGIPLASLATDAGGTTLVNGLLVETTGNQTYADRLEFDALAGVTPPASVGPASAAPETRLIGTTVAALQGITGGGHYLVIQGDAVFGDQPGSPAVINLQDMVDAVRDLNGLVVTGDATINSNLMLSTFTPPANPIVFQDSVTLGSDVTIVAGGIWFQSTLAGAGRAFRATAVQFGGPSAIVFDGDVGTPQAPLGPLQVSGLRGAVVINAAIYSTGPIDINGVSIDGDADIAIRAPGGQVSLVAANGIGSTTPIAVEAASVTARTTTGGIRLRGIGDLVVGEPGLVSGGTISLDASGDIRVPGGKVLQAAGGVTTTKPIRWGLLGTADFGPGSLRDVIGQANATRAPGIVEFGPARATFTLQSQLPDVSTSLVLDGGGRVTIDGGRRAAHGLSFVAGSAGSQLRGVAVRNFTKFGIRLLDSPGVTVSGVTVTSLNTSTSMGLYATGNLDGTTIVSSRFTGGLRGALLVDARKLTFGRIGQGNTFIGNRSVPGSKFAGTGIRAEGNCDRTVVEGNTFTQNNYGFAFINARNLRLSRNEFTSNNVAGILIEGNNLGSVSTGNIFGTRAQKNGRDVQRVRGAQGL